MRFDELILQDDEGELRVRFHPQLTVLAGLGPDDRRAMCDGILGALAGGPERTQLRYLTADGATVTLEGADGEIVAHREDGTPAPVPVGTLAPDRGALRDLVVLGPDDLGVPTRAPREDDPPELREARDMLESLTAELEAARAVEEQRAALEAELAAVDDDLRIARDNAARREYAQVLAQLERVRGEAAAVQTGTAGIEADRTLLRRAEEARALAAAWEAAAGRVREQSGAIDGRRRLDAAERDRQAAIPATPPADLDDLVDAVAAATEAREQLDQRLQALSVAKLPAPSDPLVADLGLLDQAPLWASAGQLVAAAEELHRVQLSLGGLELAEMAPAPTLVEEIEEAHRRVEDAEREAESARVPAAGGIAMGVGLALVGLATVALLVPVGLAGALAAAGMGMVRPMARRARAARAEQAALARAGATSYLAFHIRRVEATVDPDLRELVERTTLEHRVAAERWTELAGSEVDVHAALALREEIERYHEELANLGETAEEIEQLRRELDERAEPALAAARERLAAACAPYLIELDTLDDPTTLPSLVRDACAAGEQARAQVALEEAEADEAQAASRLDGLLLDLGFDAGPLDARVGALEWAVARAEEREAARARARPRAEIDAELAELERAAAALRRPEWESVTAAEAETPDIPELEARRAELVRRLEAVGPEVDVERLADRHAAVERRVAALEAQLSGEVSGDPAVIAELQAQLLAHLTTAAQAGPDDDPVPVVLDEVLLRVPADRKWDLLDLVHRLSEQHQLVYLSEDAFVAAWAHQRALDGTITLLELAPEPAEPTPEPTPEPA